MAEVEWTEDAIEDLSRLDKLIIKRILKKGSWFSNNFQRHPVRFLRSKLKAK